MSDVIQLLPDAIANQIAAGEVVQRPASVVKELLENAIDSGANEIQLSIEHSGKTMIQVQDNGCGMSMTDARMCFERHATSKIKKVDDLFDIHTFGFRGEAMASIGAVAKVDLKTRQESDEIGTQLIVEDSRVLSQEPVAVNGGTCTTVRNLFFNVPARKNFLKSNKVEQKHITDEFIRVALSRPDIALKYNSDKELIYDLKAGSFKKRIIQLFGKQYEAQLIDIKEETQIVKIEGFVATPEMARKTRGDQYFLANGRFVKSPYFNHAIIGAFEGLLPDDTYPAYFIKLTLDPARIDVNVHPTKTEVKFEDERAIYSILQTAVRKALNDFHVAPVIDFDEDRANLDNWMKGGSVFGAGQNTGTPTHKDETSTASWTPPTIKQAEGQPQRKWQSLYEGLGQDAQQSHFNTARPGEEQSVKVPFQIANKYLASAIKSGLMLIHQNRAHQRILYEKFRLSMNTGEARCQKKLFPEVVQLNTAQFKTISSHFDEINALGFDASAFGNNAVIVNGVPEAIAKESSENVIRGLADDLVNEKAGDTLSLGDKMAKSLAKSAAIKTGKSLNTDEIRSLIDQLFACEEPYFAIDGGSTIHTVSLDELDDKFN